MDMKSRLCEAEWRTLNDTEISPVFSQGEIRTKGHLPSPLRLTDLTARLSQAKIHSERLYPLQTSCYSRRNTVTFGLSNTQLDPAQKQQISSYIQDKKLSLSPRK